MLERDIGHVAVVDGVGRAGGDTHHNLFYLIRLEGLALVFEVRVGEQGRLYGSITAPDIAARLKSTSGIEVDRRSIELKEPLRTLGEFDVPVRVAHAAPNTTTITDIVYRGDGTPAAGTLLITWPAFTAADGSAVAAGSMSLTIGNAGALTAALVPNAGANPAGTYYRVVYKLNDGTTNTEYWSVPATAR